MNWAWIKDRHGKVDRELLRRYGGFLFMSFGKIVSSSSSSYFSATTCVKLLRLWGANVPPEAELAVCLFFVTGTAVINSFSRATAIYSNFILEYKYPKKKGHQTSLTTDQVLLLMKPPPTRNERYMWNGVYYVVICSVACSGFFSSTSGYLGGIKFLPFISNQPMDSATDATKGGFITTSIFVAIATGVSYKVYNFVSGKRNGRTAANWLTDPYITWDERKAVIKSYYKTIAYCFFNLTSEPQFAYFSMISTAIAMGLYSVLSADIINFIAIASTFTAFTTGLFTTVPSTYIKLNPDPAVVEALQNLTWAVYLFYMCGMVVGFFDSLNTGWAYASVVILTLSDLFNVSLTNGAIIFYGILCGLAKAYTTQNFSVRDGLIQRAEEYDPEAFKVAREKIARKKLEAEADEENQLMNTTAPLLGSKNLLSDQKEEGSDEEDEGYYEEDIEMKSARSPEFKTYTIAINTHTQTPLRSPNPLTIIVHQPDSPPPMRTAEHPPLLPLDGILIEPSSSEPRPHRQNAPSPTLHSPRRNSIPHHFRFQNEKLKKERTRQILKESEEDPNAIASRALIFQNP